MVYLHFIGRCFIAKVGDTRWRIRCVLSGYALIGCLPLSSELGRLFTSTLSKGAKNVSS